VAKVPKSDTKIDMLLRQCSRLKGRKGVLEELVYGASVCAHCREDIRAEGQEALQAMATIEGIYFRCARPCKCGCSMGFVTIDVEPEVQEGS